ncbi:AAA family ATPase [Nocardia sp. NPDC056100]|uniref:AAA family ATPase n=1 Tax=Nocardia sp. NPDC056100 TaxID=3345712 RepID=UPI0035DC906A
MSDDTGQLVGRSAELDEIAGLIASTRNGLGQALCLMGDPGIGKTALLDAAIARATGFLVLRLNGYEIEQSLPYAGVQRLLAQFDAEPDELPEHEREALAVAAGHHAGPVPDRFLVGRALLGLLALTARRRPVVCAIDDAQWMDRESLDALGFAARRLHADAVLVLFAARPDADVDVHLGGITAQPVPELERAGAIELLTTLLGVRFDPRVAAGIVDAVGGNPLALTDLANDTDPRQLADSTFAPHPPGAGQRLERLYQRQVRDLPPATQQWLLVAAAESTGDLRLLDAAAADLGIDENAGEAADSAGLVIIDRSVRFRHPLIRAAVYGAAPGADRRRVHAALARAAADSASTDVHAWHAAEAAPRPDDRVAALLLAAAARAGQRGGLLSRASLLRRAAELTTDPALRREHLLDAAEAAAEAGAAQRALDLLDRIEDTADSDPVATGRELMLRASAAIFLIDPQRMPEAHSQLATAADLFHGRDAQREQLALLRAFDAVLPVERLRRGSTLAELGERMRSAAAVREGVTATVLAGVAALILDPYATAVEPIRAAVAAMAELDDERILVFGTAGVALTTALWDERARDRHLEQGERIAVAHGALRALDIYLWMRSLSDVDRGDMSTAGRTIERVRETRRAMGFSAENVINSSYLAWTGAPYELIEQLAEATLAAGVGGVYSATMHALAVRDLADGRYDVAYDKLASLRQHAFLQAGLRYLPEFVEAAVRSGHLDEAVEVTGQLVAMAAANRTAWARGIGARCLALIDETPSAEHHFNAALAILATTDTPGDLDRAHLLYGEWLRRRRRRKAASIQLRRARDGFERAGVIAFAERARRELAALGEQPESPRQPTAHDGLTVQESQVATLAAGGATNAEIAATLFLSPSTVDYHLRKVFRKLGISSRRQLREHMPPADRQ